MELIELKQKWQACDKKIDAAIQLNLTTLKALKVDKAKNKILQFKVLTAAGLVAAIAWIIFVAYFVYQLRDFTAFVVSAAAILLITLVGAINYIRQLALTEHFNYDEDIATAQEKLYLLKLSVIQNSRIGFLQLPFYATMFISNSMLNNGTPLQWAIYGSVTIVLAAMGVWLYRSLRIENMHKKWVHNLLNGIGLGTLSRAADFVTEIRSFKQQP